MLNIFKNCNNLTSVTVEAKTPPDIKSNSFTNRTNATLRVPAGSIDAYASATWWRDFGTIQEIVESKVKLNKTKVIVAVGKTRTLKATVYPETLEDKSVTWESSDTEVATVTSAGKVKGIRTGTATITCTSNATGLSATCEVTVTAAANSRSLGGGNDGVTGIDDMDVDPAVEEPFDVYDMSGRKVRHQVTSLDGLPNGIYIVNGRKVLKKE